jgi:Protein involved in cell division
MSDPYLLPDSNVLRNLLGITDSAELDLAEAELSRASMMMLYEQGFDDFSSNGIQAIHKALFGDVYDWAGEFRIINIQKREPILAGISVWYSNSDDIQRDLDLALKPICDIHWNTLSIEDFVERLVKLFPVLWKVHPFREGNTRTIVMLMTFFIEHYGFFVDQELLAESAGYVRNAFVMANLDKYAEYEHLEHILRDAVSLTPIQYSDDEDDAISSTAEKYSQYKSGDYKPIPHEYREE